jgi:hypothetical protein
MRSVEDPRAPSLILFAALSLGLHAGSFGVLNRCRSQPQFAVEPSSKTLVGTSFDMDPSLVSAALEETDGPGEAEAAKVPAAPNGDLKRPRLGAAAGSEMPRPSSGPEPLFGAVGERFATDLATTFTRAFAQAASADSVWTAAPFGATGAAVVTLGLDEMGHLAGSSIAGSPTIALRRGIERALALLAPRAFTARSAFTRLRISAQVTRDVVHDGLHGDVFALSGGSFSGDVGTAFFALPPGIGPGRRVDVELRLLR